MHAGRHDKHDVCLCFTHASIQQTPPPTHTPTPTHLVNPPRNLLGAVAVRHARRALEEQVLLQAQELAHHLLLVDQGCLFIVKSEKGIVEAGR